MTNTDPRRPDGREFMRRKAVAFELGITRHTLSRTIATDPDFPSFFEISPGVEVIERADLDRWLAKKKMQAQANRLLCPILDKNAAR